MANRYALVTARNGRNYVDKRRLTWSIDPRPPVQAGVKVPPGELRSPGGTALAV